MTEPHRRDLLLAVSSAAATGSLWSLLRRPELPGTARWRRTNHAGDPVTLLEGVALVGGVVATSAAGAAVPGPRGTLAAVAVAALAAGGVGTLDDLRLDPARKGLAGHLGALARGHLTTGALKVLVLAGSGVVATAVADQGREGPRAGAGHRVLDTVLGGAVVAGCANLANLLDLRPGRALKAGLLGALPLLTSGSGSAPAAVALGAGAVLLPDDLRATAMLGDTGANPWGATLGLALVEQSGTRGRATALAVLTALTLASEKVSFTQVIEATPGLRTLDAWGRPAPGTTQGPEV